MANTPDFKRSNGRWANAVGGRGSQIFTRSGRLWNNIRSRTLAGGKKQRDRPTYAGVECTFTDFQDFANWAVKQIGYNIDGWELDKDLLNDGTGYSKTSCVFVPSEINKFLEKSTASRGTLPVGVCKHQNGFMASCRSPLSGTYIGLFSTPDAAYLAYKARKEEVARYLANKWSAQVDPRVTCALLNYEVLITH